VTAPLVGLGRPDGRSRWLVEHGGRGYLVFVHNGEYVVTDAACPHRGGPLVNGLIRGDTIVCPWHWYAYDLGTGACRNASEVALTRYPAHLRDGELFADIAAPEATSWSQRLRRHARTGD
jgi:nitrite reductase/ring-hydroxylating ferredoxin subunit